MSLAVPSALILAALALPIIVFYILKVRLRRIPVSTNLFWKQIYDEKPPRSIWQHLRHLLSLLAQLLLLALMVLALADPYFSWQALQARRMVAVIDASASMQATDISPSRFDASVDSAIQLVDGMRFRDKMAIVLAGKRPEVVLGMSDHIPTLKRALRNINVSENPTDLEAAIELGNQLIGDHANGSVVVFTDACDESLAANEIADSPEIKATDHVATSTTSAPINSDKAQSEPKVDIRVFATEAANVGITQFQVRRSLIDMLGYEVLVSVKNASELAINCRLEIELDGFPVDVLPLKLKPGELWSRSLEKTSLEGGTLVAKLSDFNRGDVGEDETASDDNTNNASTKDLANIAPLNSLEVDDVAWAILPAQTVQNVLVVTQGNLFLRKVFEANPLVNVRVTSEFPETWPDDTLFVLHNQIPERLPPGNVFVIDPVDSCDAWELGPVLENPIVTDVDSESDLMTHVRLDNVVMPEARKLLFKSEPHVLAGAVSSDPIYAELKRKSGKGLVLSVNLERSDLAFRTAFPIMVTNALSWFSGSSGALRESASTGSILAYEPDFKMIQSMRDDAAVKLISPSGKEVPVAIEPTQTASSAEPDAPDTAKQVPEQISLGPLGECGIWKLQMNQDSESSAGTNDTADVAEFAVNISSLRETDLSPPASMLENGNQVPSLAGWFAKPVWYYLIGLVGVLMLFEWYLYQRRLIS